MIASYFASSTGKILVLQVSATDRTPVAEIIVSGKAEARRIAAERGAKCWNF